MSSLYTPDVWVVVKFQGSSVPDGEAYKILAGWYGGYTGSDSWKLNSGITKITEQDSHYLVEGYSGSVYQCGKHCERTSSYTATIFEGFRHQLQESKKNASLEIVPMESMKAKFI